MPTPHHTMTNSGYMQYDPMENSHIMSRVSPPETPSYYNEAVLSRRHEIMLTKPTNPAHDQIRQMWMDKELTLAEFGKLLDETPGNRVMRNTLLVHLKDSQIINETLFAKLYSYA